MYTFGNDAAHYEWNINWEKIRRAGSRYCFLKTSQGIVKDERVEVHYAGAVASNFPVGFYHFYDPRWREANPKRQAEFFWGIVKDKTSKLPLVVDIELYKSGPYHGWKYWYDFIERLKELAPGREIMIYTGYFFWTEEGPAWWDLPRHVYFSQYPLWLAYYPGGLHPPTTTPEAAHLIPVPWKMKGWMFWQTSDKNTLDGVTSEINRPANVDYDFFNGTEEQFYSRFGINNSIPAGDVFSQVISLNNSTNIPMKEIHDV